MAALTPSIASLPAYARAAAAAAANAAAATFPNFSNLPPKPSTSFEPVSRFFLDHQRRQEWIT